MPIVTPLTSGSYSSPARLYPAIKVLKLLVADQPDVVVPCVMRARQYNRVVGWRSTSGVYEVVPPAPSGMLGFCATTAYAAKLVPVVAKSALSEIWNS